MTAVGRRFHVFPYREEEPRVGGGHILRPTVDLTVINGGHELTVRALVDTGAPTCIFGRAVADALYVDLDVVNSRPLSILGQTVRATTAMVTLSLAPFVGVEWTVEAAFLHADLNVSYLGVLGNEGFLDRWVASFNYHDNYFMIEEHESWVARTNIDFDEVDVILGEHDDDWRPPPD